MASNQANRKDSFITFGEDLNYSVRNNKNSMKNFKSIDREQLLVSSEERMPRDVSLNQQSKVDPNRDSFRNGN